MPPAAPSATPSATGPIHRFGGFVEQLKRAIAEGIGRNHDTLGPLAILLWTYLGRTLRRLAALHARFEAGMPLAPRRCAAAPHPSLGRPAAPHASPASHASHASQRLPRGAVLARFRAGHLYAALERLVAEPEMRSLLAAAPQAGRLLRPLWRMLTRDPLPAALRLPPRPRRGRQALSSAPADAPAAPAAAPTDIPPDIPPGITSWRPRPAPADPPPPTFRPGSLLPA